MKRIAALLLLLVLAVSLYQALSRVPFGTDHLGVSRYYLDHGVQDLGGVNIVTSVVVLYRGFDTLGEVTVLFLAATGLAALLHGLQRSERRRPKRPPSLIMKTATRILFPTLLLLGAYVFVHGHLTPGGGFPGGVVVALAYLLGFLAHDHWQVNHRWIRWVEGLAGMTYVVIGLAGLYVAGSFLANFLPLGTPGRLFSAGVIPLIYITIGFKVGSEMTGLLSDMKETTE